jgi:hypothetical protein
MMNFGWQQITFRDRTTGRVVGIEVTPEKDRRRHVSDPVCACHPKFESVSGIPMLIHNSFDGREKFENLRDQ